MEKVLLCQQYDAVKPPHYPSSNSSLLKTEEWDTLSVHLDPRDTNEPASSSHVADFPFTDQWQVLQSKHCSHSVFCLILRVIDLIT